MEKNIFIVWFLRTLLETSCPNLIGVVPEFPVGSHWSMFIFSSCFVVVEIGNTMVQFYFEYFFECLRYFMI